MTESQKISKLGTSNSEIFQLEEKFKKKYVFNSETEAKSIIKGVELISESLPGSVELPLKYEIFNPEKNKIEFIYEQKKLNPWIKPEWITGLQLFSIGLTILEQQSLLVKNGLCFVDARPSNYWLAINNGRLVDLGSIKPLSRQNILSFLSDFNNHFINTLRLETELNIPVSQFFQGNLQTCKINNWGLTKTIKNITSIKEEIKYSLTNFFSNIISSSSPEFIDFINEDYAKQSEVNLSLKKVEKLLINLKKQFLLSKPKKIENSNWNNYKTFHDEKYNQKKLKLIKDYVKRKSLTTKIIDIGSNLTTSNLDCIYTKVDNDMSICREMRQISEDDQIILQIDVANYLCNININSDNPLNCVNCCKSGIFAGIIHHLIIDYGLGINNFYKNTSLLFNDILLEFPTIEDPMVNLLINKKNENIEWDWEKNHLEICKKYFNLVKKTQLSKTRFVVELSKK